MLTMDDLEAIKRVKYRYLRALDTKHWADFADTLTDDVVGNYGSGKSHLMAALPTLTRTLRYGDVRGTDVSALVDVADSLLIRICTGLAVAVTGLDDPSAEEFREHLGGRLTVTMLEGIGHGTDVHEIDHALMRESIESVAARAGAEAT